MATITITADKNIDECISPMMVGVVTGGTVGSSCPLNAQSGTWTARTLPSSSAWNCVCAGDDRFVAVAGGPGTAAGYTIDGTNWVASTLPASKEWKSVIWAGDRFVAVCYGAVDSAYSYNGVNWTAGGSLPSTANWQAMAYDPASGTIVVTSTTTAGAYSTDGGATWSSSTLPTGDWRSVTFGESLFVAVSYGSNDATTSSDGITWDATPDDLPASVNWSSVAYGNGNFVAVAYGSTQAAFSTNGTTWSSATMSTNVNWNTVMYCPSNTGLGAASVSMFYATAYGSNVSNYSLDNGETWSADTVSASANWTSYAYIGAMSGDTLTIADGATVTCNTNQKRFWKTINVNNGSLAIANTSTSAGLRFAMGRVVTGSSANSINVNGLGTMTVTGNFIELGTGDGTANQHVHSWGTDFVPCLWVETGSGTGVFELWHNLTAQSSPNMLNYCYTDNSTMKYAGAGAAGRFFTQGQHAGNPETGSKFKDQWTNVLTFGDGTNGAVVPNGAKVKMPNIVLTDDTQCQNLNTSYLTNILMTSSGQLTVETALFDFMYLDCTTAALIDLTDVGFARRMVVTKCANFSLERVGSCCTPDLVYYAAGLRTVYQNFSGAYIWSYINNGYIRDLSLSFIGPLAATNSASTLTSFQFQYCNNMDVSGLYVYKFNSFQSYYSLILDFVNYSTFENLYLYGAGWYVSNCTETTVNGVEYLTAFDNRSGGTGTYPTFMYDKDGNTWTDGSDYYFKWSGLNDINFLTPFQDSGYDSHVKPFVPTLSSFPYYIGMTPGSNTVSCNWGPASILPQHNAPAFDLFRDTAIIQSGNVTMTIASPCVVTWTGSNLADDQPIVFTTSGDTLPTGITAGTTYYVNAIDADTFNIAATADGANINTSGTQSGTHTCTTGIRAATTNTTTTIVLTDATALNGTKYYYVLRKYETTGNVKDTNWCDSASMEVTPRAALTYNNYCLQSDVFENASWVKTNISGTGTPGAKQGPIPASTASADLLVATGNATAVQTITGLTAGNTYTWYVALSTDDTIADFKIRATSGATTQETTVTLQHYWKLPSVTITIPVGSTTCALTIGSGTSWTSGMRVYACMSQFDLGSIVTPYLPTTTAAITGRLYHQITRALWNWKERTVQIVYDTKTTATSTAFLYGTLHQDTTGAFTMTLTNMVYRHLGYRWNYFSNNINCDFQGFSHSTLERHFHGVGAAAYGSYVANCNTCNFLNFNFQNTGRAMRRTVYTSLGSKDCLFSNWVVEQGSMYPLDATASTGAQFYTDNSNAGLTYQNFFSDAYDIGFIGNVSKNTIVKGVAGGLGTISDLAKPGDYIDSVGRAYTSVFDNNFYELYTSANNGMLCIRFNGSEKTTGSAIAISGSCGFDATGKLYIWDTDASITFTWPYKIHGTDAFRNVAPRFNTTFWTSTATADVVSKPIGLTVEYDINTAGDWTALTAANLAAEDISAPFDFRIRITANRVLEYDGETGGGFNVSDTVTGATSGATGVIAEIDDRGAYGQLRLTDYTLGSGVNPFVNNENLQVGGSTKGVANLGTTYSDNTFPNAGNYIDALDIFTEVDQTYYYSPYTGGTLYLTTCVTDGGDYVMTAPATIVFSGTETPTAWNLSDSTFNTTSTQKITLTNTSGAAITVAMPNGVDVINTGVGVAAITVTAPPINTGIDFSGIVAGSTVKVFETGTQTVIATVTGPDWKWEETYSADQDVDYTIQKAGYLPIRVTGFSCGNTVQTVAVSQIPDRSYVASSDLAFGSTAIVTPAAKTVRVTTATTVQNWYSFMVESWITEATLQNVAFPFTTNGPNSFTLGDGWVWSDGATSIAFLSRDGMRYLNASGNVTAMWAAILTSGTAAGLQVRYQQTNGGTTVNAKNTGPMDQLIQILSDPNGDGNFADGYDYRDHLVLKVQKDGYDQAEADVVGTFGNLEDQFYVAGLNPISNGLTTGDPSVTGVTITDHGASPVTWNGKVFSITITDSAEGHTGEEIMRWIRFNCDAGGTFEGLDAFGWHDLVQINGSSYKTVRGNVWGDTGSTLKGVRVVQSDGSTAHASFNLFTADDGTTYAPPATATITVSGATAGSRVQIYDTTNSVELYNGTPSFPYVYSEVYSSEKDIRVRVAYVDGLNANKFISANAGTISATTLNLTYPVTQSTNTVYETNSVDGSTVTECSITGSTLRIYIDDPDNTTTAQRIYNWFQYYLFTEAGIADQADYISATDSTHYVVDNSFKIINQDTANPLNLTGANIVPTSGAATNIFDLTNGASIALNFNRVEGFSYSSGSGLSTEEHDTLLALPTSIAAVDVKVDDASALIISK